MHTQKAEKVAFFFLARHYFSTQEHLSNIEYKARPYCDLEQPHKVTQNTDLKYQL